MVEEKEIVIREYKAQLAVLQPEFGLKNVEAFVEKAYDAFENVEPQMHVVFGNAKLPETTAIVSCGTWFNCAGRTEGFCELAEVCYDKCREVMSSDITRFRLEEEIAFRSLSSDGVAEQISRQIRVQNARENHPNVKQIRWNEVGEMRNQDDLIKIVEVSNILYNEFGVHSYIYTHNKYLDFDLDRPHLTILGSGFMVDNEYKVFEDINEMPENFFDCHCDCTQCNVCPMKLGIVIGEEVRK